MFGMRQGSTVWERKVVRYCEKKTCNANYCNFLKSGKLKFIVIKAGGNAVLDHSDGGKNIMVSHIDRHREELKREKVDVLLLA